MLVINYLGLQPVWLVPTHQNSDVKEPIYNGNSYIYFISVQYYH